jgi:hypothetical protein
MSENDERIDSASPEIQLDRLVDGELNDTDRRETLLRLEREPEGWRLCALAFLEAQCWKQELGSITRMAPRAEREPDKTVVVRPASGFQPAVWRRQLATVLTMGACFLIALALGMGLRGNMSRGGHGPNSEVTTTTNVFPLNRSATQSSGDQWELVPIVADSPNGRRETVNIPAVHRDSLDERMLAEIPDVIPPEIRRSLEQAGHQIEEHRQVVPVQMNDGRRLMVPVNNVQIHFVGRGSL